MWQWRWPGGYPPDSLLGQTSDDQSAIAVEAERFDTTDQFQGMVIFSMFQMPGGRRDQGFFTVGRFEGLEQVLRLARAVENQLAEDAIWQ